MFSEFVIQPKTEGKGRTFRAVRLAAVTADAFWDLSGGKDAKHSRPVYASFAASDGEIRPFVANLLTGRPAVPLGNDHSYRRRGSDSGYEFMKSAGYKVFWQRGDAGTVATIFLPGILDLDPGMVDPKGVKFVVLAGADYLRKEAERMPVEEIVDYARRLPVVKAVNEPEKDWRGHVREGWEEPLSRERLSEMVPIAYLHALYLSNRSRAPIPPDGRFYLQLLLAFLQKGIASFGSNDYHDKGFGKNGRYGFSEEGNGRLAPGVAFMADHSKVETVLAAECAEYFKRVK